jgi:hypothetical protein
MHNTNTISAIHRQKNIFFHLHKETPLKTGDYIFFSILLNTSTGEYIILFSILPNIIECIKQTPIKTSKYGYYQMTLRFDTSIL